MGLKHASRGFGRWACGFAALGSLAVQTSAECVAQHVLTATAQPYPLLEFTSRFDDVLGTLMELTVHAPAARDAAECERQVLCEIDRLSAILSTYDASSEITYVMNGGAIASDELDEVLALYGEWQNRTGGAIHSNLAAVRQVWRAADTLNEFPSDSDLHAAFAQPRAYNIDALGKAYIIDRAVAVARQFAPAGLLNIGGDIRVWGDQPWRIGIADPLNPADNAAPIQVVHLQNAAIATSGSYARTFTLGGIRYSHLLDPRTLHPVSDIERSATAIADDCVTANAVATAGCILDFTGAAALASQYANGHLITTLDQSNAGGVIQQMAGKATISQTTHVPQIETATPLAVDAKWMKDFRVEIPIVLKVPTGPKVKHPYVVVWIENSDGKPVRNITLWGKQDRYLPHLSTWWKLINMNLKGVQSIAAATRPAGKYMLYWDGKSDSGKVMPQGTYSVRIEISREHGSHAESTISIDCKDKPETATTKETAESDESTIEYKRAKR